MSKRAALAISSIALAIAAITCLYIIMSGNGDFLTAGVFLCTATIYFSSFVVSK